MNFLDPKEDMLKIILTEYGRELLSKGEFEIVYFAFGDDEIDYQTPFNTSGSIG